MLGCQDAQNAQDADLMLLASGINTCVSDVQMCELRARSIL